MNFSDEPLPEDLIENMIKTKVWSKQAPVALEDLRLLKVMHYDFNANIKEGKIVVHNKITANSLKIFQELFDIKFPIDKIKTIDEYEGDDNKSMEDNNSSCFNYRAIPFTDTLSTHSYGLSIDINPVQNPYIIIENELNCLKIYPDSSKHFLNRNNLRDGMVEPIVNIFSNNGFKVWGGNWNDSIDYHHFQFIAKDQIEEFLKG